MPQVLPVLHMLVSSNIYSPEESGSSSAWVAADAKEMREIGVYYEDRRQIKSSTVSHEEAKQVELWSWTVKTVAQDEHERKQFDIESSS